METISRNEILRHSASDILQILLFVLAVEYDSYNGLGEILFPRRPVDSATFHRTCSYTMR